MTHMRRLLVPLLALPLLLAAASCQQSLCACSTKDPTSAANLATALATSAPKASATVPAAIETLPPLQRTSAHYPGGAIEVELALNPRERERGLSYRDSLPQSSGMLFDMGESAVPVFWMKGMRFALDMVWIDDAKTVVSVTADIPPQSGAPDDQLVKYSPDTPARYVLELNAGVAARLALTPGARLAFDVQAP